MSDDQLEELHEVPALGGVRRANILPELLDMLGVGVKLYRIQDFVHALAEDGIVDVEMVIIDELVGQEGHKATEFVQS